MQDYFNDPSNPMIMCLYGPTSYPVTDFNLLCGVDASFLMMNHFKNDNNVKSMFPDYTFKEIKWLKIHTNEMIPLNINEFNLSLISQEVYFDYYDLDNNYLGQKPYLLECRKHSIYTELNTFSSRMMSYYEYILSLLDKKINIFFLRFFHKNQISLTQ